MERLPDGALQNEELWRRTLVDGHPLGNRVRAVMKHLPSAPRCRVCFNPFEGFGGWAVGLIGFRRSRKNPNLCSLCCDQLPQGGAEVDIAVLFADVRGSTALGERLGPRDFARLLQRFYTTATEALVAHDAVIDKMVGDQVVALFIPGIAGPTYRQRAALAAADLLRAVGYSAASEPWLPLGVSVHAGLAYVGNFGGEGMIEFTALGDTVNVGAKLQATASAGEIVCSADVFETVADRYPGLTSTDVSVAGRERPLPVYRLAAERRDRVAAAG